MKTECTTSSSTSAVSDRREFVFAASQLIFWPLGGTYVLNQRRQYQRRIHDIPQLRNTPLKLELKNNRQEVVSDDQLLECLARLRPERTAMPPKVNHLDHALRMWGPEIAFGDDRLLDGNEMLSILTDDRALRKNLGTDVRPLLVDMADGPRVRTQEGPATASHVDHTLATLTEIGTPLNFPLRTRKQAVHLGDLVGRSLRTFSLNQSEYEWTSLVLALYSTNADPWITGEGQEITFDRLATRIMREQMGLGVCFGGHRLFTLATMLRVDQEIMPLFSETVRNQIRHHLALATRTLVASQHADGWWDDSWPGHKIPTNKPLWTQGARIVATGHALEWWALLPEHEYIELLPPRESVVRGGQWLVRELEVMEPESIRKNYTFLTHAGRALSMWRGETPDQSWNRLADGTTKLASKLWSDSNGAILSIEFILLATIVVIGTLTGLATYRDAVVQEAGDSAAAIAALTQSFEFDGIRQSGTFGTGISEVTYSASIPASTYVDNYDAGEAVLETVGDGALCITIQTIEDEQ